MRPLWALAAAALLGAAAPAGAQRLQHVEAADPVALGDALERMVVVEATVEETLDVPRDGARRSVTQLRFRNGIGRVIHQETLRTRLVPGQGFQEEVRFGAVLELRGAGRRFLLLRLDGPLNAPSGGSRVLVYGFDDRGRFRPLGPAFHGPADIIANPVDRAGKVVLLREGRYLDVRQWMGNFTLILPYTFKPAQHQFLAASPCGRVEVEPQPPREGTAVLFAKPGLEHPMAAVKVTPASRVEFLGGCRGEGRAPRDPTVWIHVRVDGQEGWLPGEEAVGLGLPDAG
jgi:hypothetical protein